MKAGIVAYGAYIPIYRLNRAEIGKVWGCAARGERAVANCDEDSLTIGVEAALDCLKGIDRHTVDALYFASTTSPYREKRSATIMAAALDLQRDIVTADFANSVGAGGGALRAALDAVNAGSARNVLVVTADCRIPAPNSAPELVVGDGAAALLVGSEDVIATIENSCSFSSDFLDVWRKENDSYARTWEDRYVVEKGYSTHLREAVNSLLKKSGLKGADFAKAAYYAPDSRSHTNMARALGLDKAQVQEPMFDVLGNTGASFFMMNLVAALESAKAGEKVIAASYGDGADAWILQATENLGRMRDRRGVAKHLASKMMLPNYGSYLRFRDLMEWEGTHIPQPESSANVFYREQKALIRGYGQKCKVCGHVQFPPQRVCMWCQAKDQFADYRIVDKTGKVFTFSLDERAVFALDLPNVLVIVDLEGGGRIYNQATDRDPKKLKVGTEMEFTFRKFHDGSGFHNYSWKMRPVRC